MDTELDGESLLHQYLASPSGSPASPESQASPHPASEHPRPTASEYTLPVEHVDGRDDNSVFDLSKEVDRLPAADLMEHVQSDTDGRTPWDVLELFSRIGDGPNSSGNDFPFGGNWQEREQSDAQKLVNGEMTLSQLAQENAVDADAREYETGTMNVSMPHDCRVPVDDVLRMAFGKKKNGTVCSVQFPLQRTESFGHPGRVIESTLIQLQAVESKLRTGYGEPRVQDGAQYEKSSPKIGIVAEQDTSFNGFITQTGHKRWVFDFHSNSVPEPIMLTVKRRVDMANIEEEGRAPPLPSTAKTPLLWCMVQYDVNDPGGTGKLTPHNNDLTMEPINGKVGSLGGFVNISFVDDDGYNIELPFNLYSFNDRHEGIQEFTFKIRVGANVDPAVYRPVFFSLQYGDEHNTWYRLRPVAAMDAILVIPANPNRKRAVRIPTKWHHLMDMQMQMKMASTRLTYNSAAHTGSASTQNQDDEGGQANTLPPQETHRRPIHIPGGQRKRKGELLEERMQDTQNRLTRCFTMIQMIAARIQSSGPDRCFHGPAQ